MVSSDTAPGKASAGPYKYDRQQAVALITNAPYAYLDGLPNPKTLVPLVDGLQVWFHLPGAELATIRTIVHTVDQTTLLIDDVLDNDTERRGSAATHLVFGIGHTISTALVKYGTIAELASTLSERAYRSLLDELKILYTGHTHEFFQTYNCVPPPIPVHLKVLEQSSLFRMASRMMQAEATKNQDLNISNFINVLGRYYQILNDFQDITDTALGKISLSEKDDLDQGTFTLTLIHALSQQEKSGRTELIEIMRSRSDPDGLSVESKARALELIKEAGSLDYTKSVLDEAHEELMHEVDAIDQTAGSNNEAMRQYLGYLKSLVEIAAAP
ncbi:hypothetical protein DL765_004054 [Monosporascus sp. GIB2]|nr:hypothetical protein DL765_004054 [Monosporascus sp. GIB2]